MCLLPFVRILGNNACFSPSLTKKTIAARRQQLFGTLTSSSLLAPPLPTLPFDLITDIPCRLPVKYLVQFRCVCKSWNSLISDPKFAEKHLRLSTTRLVHTLTYSNLPYKYILKSCRLHSVFNNLTTNQTAHPITQLKIPWKHVVSFLGSCNGILCLLACGYTGFVTIRLWNPSIRKFNELPYLGKQQGEMYGFGYDAVTNNYKVVVVFEDEVKVYTLSTDSWKNIQKFPFACVSLYALGTFVSGTINWLVSTTQYCILSLDLGSDSFKELLLPDYEVVYGYMHLEVLKDCLCIVVGRDVWVMKEHGINDSWTKLFTISYMQDLPTLNETIRDKRIFDDGQVLLKSKEERKWKMIFYNSSDGTFKFYEFENIVEVCTESLISPCS